jgi:hypothetical protein
MTYAQEGSNLPLAGIISTAPGQVLGDQTTPDERPVALSGRVPTHVNLEGGPIAVGDRIAPSSVPGVGKKAGPFDDSVGIALQAYDGTASSSEITVFIDLQKGTDISAVGQALLGQDATSTSSNPFDFIGGIMNALSSRLAAITSAASSSAATSSAATSSPSIDAYASNFVQSIFGQLVQWFANTGNGIDQFFANVGNFGRVNTNDLCVQGTCVTGAQLTALLAANNIAASTENTTSTTTATNATTTPPTIQINGANPALIQVGATYTDLGATITGPQADLNLGFTTYVNGTVMNPVQIDTATAATDTIDYVVTDASGLTATSTRTVIVQAPVAPDTSVPDTDTESASTDPTLTATSTASSN